MPVIKCSNGKWRIGSGKCMYTTKEDATKAYQAYLAQKNESINEDNNVLNYDEIFWNAGFSSRYDGEYDPEQLAMGIEVEYEHTTNKEMSEKIAKDHLAEIPDYYTRLKAMEEQAKAEGSFNSEVEEVDEEKRIYELSGLRGE